MHLLQFAVAGAAELHLIKVGGRRQFHPGIVHLSIPLIIGVCAVEHTFAPAVENAHFKVLITVDGYFVCVIEPIGTRCENIGQIHPLCKTNAAASRFPAKFAGSDAQTNPACTCVGPEIPE